METTGNADIDFTYAQALMKTYPNAVYRKNLDMVKTQVTEEGHLGLLLVIDIN